MDLKKVFLLQVFQFPNQIEFIQESSYVQYDTFSNQSNPSPLPSHTRIDTLDNRHDPSTMILYNLYDTHDNILHSSQSSQHRTRFWRIQ